MKLNLSQQIKLEHVPKRYYSPDNEIDKVALRREEKVNVQIYPSVEDGARELAREVAAIIARNVKKKGKCTLALSSGKDTLSAYIALVYLYKQGKVSFRNVEVYNLSEFYTNYETGQQSLKLLKEAFLDHVDIPKENIHTFSKRVTKDSIFSVCRDYEREIEDAGGIDIAICNIGMDGSLGINEPGAKYNNGCRLVLLDTPTRLKLANDYKWEEPPQGVITLGIANILEAKHIFCVAWGENYAHIIKKIVEGEITYSIPATTLQRHRDATLIMDIPAADELTRISHPWKVTSCEWDDKLTRRALVWLCAKTGKPILKLTDRDYNEWGLGELLTIYGSAYLANIKIFNDLQHTITGWPGGKPGADDATRPERSTPFPKRVLIFSPHPDDDVISMGGTFKRLVDQKHDVHVAYETSGNIAVGDEDMMRYVMLMDGIAPQFGLDSEKYSRISADIHEFIEGKKPGDIDSEEIRRLKTVIRQCEARTACKYIGVKDENVHFLNLPFYETGAVKKGDLSERDVEIVKKLLQEVQPDEIFVAGDLADPHGTHRVCLDAVLAAIDDLKDEKWMQDCYVWMYRGAWAEWEIDHIEMAVPLSPEELRFKRNSILKHQSQAENAPFLGDDDRLFWQRAEDRNRATAKLYESLGLAAYEAIEAFVRYRH